MCWFINCRVTSHFLWRRGENGPGCWVLRPVDSDPNKCLFEWLLDTDLKVFIFQAVFPDPDPHVFGPHGSGSISQRYGSGSGSFYQQAKIVRKTLIPTVFWLRLDFLSLKNDVNVPSKSNKQENFFKNLFFVGILKVYDENSRIRIQDPDPDLNPDPLVRGMDPRIRIHTKMSWIRNTASRNIIWSGECWKFFGDFHCILVTIGLDSVPDQ